MNGTQSPDGIFFPGQNDSEILHRTFRFYGSISLSCFVVFCVARRHAPRMFNLRLWVDGLKCQLSEDCAGFGYIEWIWKVLRYKDSEIREQCGIDAVCLLRMFKFGMKLCLIGIVNSVWLFPIYATSNEKLWDIGNNGTVSGELPTDPVARASVSSLPPGSHRLIAPVVASYIVFIFTMYLIFQEYAWFAEQRHAYLSERQPRNYAVYVSGIPRVYRTDAALADFFRRLFGHDAVRSATVYRRVPRLQAKVATQKQLVERIEHAWNLQEQSTNTLMQSFRKKEKRSKSGSIEEDMVRQLANINHEIRRDMAHISSADMHEQQPEHPDLPDHVKSIIDLSHFNVKEGQYRDAGFVCFTKRTARQAALRMIHSSEPYALTTLEDNLFPRNVGKSHRQVNIGKLISIALTSGLRIAWTFPTVFIASLAHLENLGNTVEFAAQAIANHPWLIPFSSIGSPMVLLILNSALPTLLEWITLFELPLSQASLIARQFPKLATFMIIQTFFVTVLSGSFLESLEQIGDIFTNSQDMLDFLGRALPEQSVFFIQLLLVKTFVGIPYQLLQVSPFLKATIRRFVGPNSTPEQSSQTYLRVIRPLCKPLWLLHSEVASANVLYFMVFFVYSSTAPLVNWILMFCFLALYPTWSYQIFCNYPVKPDTGGHIYYVFLAIIRISTIIGQVALWAILALKRYPHAIAWMLPLLIGNLVFNVYIRQRHEKIAYVLPSEDCLAIDENDVDDSDFSFLNDAYQQNVLLSNDSLVPKQWSADHKTLYESTLGELEAQKDTWNGGSSELDQQEESCSDEETPDEDARKLPNKKPLQTLDGPTTATRHIETKPSSSCKMPCAN